MDPLTLLVIVLIICVLFGGYGYRSGWYEPRPYYGGGALGVVLLIIIILIVLRLLGQL